MKTINLFKFKKLNKQENTEENEIIQKEKKDKQEIRKENNANKISNLYNQLVELQEKIEKDNLSPIRKFFIENKIARIETKLEREIAKLDVLQCKQLFKEYKGQLYEMYNERLKEEQNKLDNIFDEIESRQIVIELKEQLVKKREKEYKKINNSGKNKKDTYKFTSSKTPDNTLMKYREEIEQLNSQVDLKLQEIDKIKKEFDEFEKEVEEERKIQIKEYKPLGFFARFKIDCQKIYNNFINMVKNYKAENELVKKARENIRAVQNIQNANNSKLRMEEFRNKLEHHIEPTKEEIEARRQETQKQLTAQEKALETYKEMSKKLEGAKWKYENGTYVPETKDKESKIISFSDAKETGEQSENNEEIVVSDILTNKPETTVGEIIEKIGEKDAGGEKNAGEYKYAEKEDRASKLDRDAERRKKLSMDGTVQKIDHKKAEKVAYQKAMQKEAEQEQAIKEYERTGIM